MMESQNIDDLGVDRLIDRKQLGAILGTSAGGIVQLEIRHNLPVQAVRIGRLVRYRMSDVRAFIAKGNQA